MTDAPKPAVIGIAEGSSQQAPFIYFDDAATTGVNYGIIQIELAAKTLLPEPPSVRTDVLITAHLRCSPNAAVSLKDAIEKALEMMKLPSGTVTETAKQ